MQTAASGKRSWSLDRAWGPGAGREVAGQSGTPGGGSGLPHCRSPRPRLLSCESFSRPVEGIRLLMMLQFLKYMTNT